MSIQDISSDDIETPLESAVLQSDDERDEIALAQSTPPVSVFISRNDDEGGIIRALLESEGIPAIYDNHTGIMNVPALKLADEASGRVLVSVEDEARARELIAAYSTPVTDEEIDDAAAAGA